MKKLSEKYPSRLKSKESHNVRLTTQNNDIDEFDYRLEENVFFFLKNKPNCGSYMSKFDILKIILAFE